MSFSINFKCKVTTDSLAIIHQTVCLCVIAYTGIIYQTVMAYIKYISLLYASILKCKQFKNSTTAPWEPIALIN